MSWLFIFQNFWLAYLMKNFEKRASRSIKMSISDHNLNKILKIFFHDTTTTSKHKKFACLYNSGWKLKSSYLFTLLLNTDYHLFSAPLYKSPSLFLQFIFNTISALYFFHNSVWKLKSSYLFKLLLNTDYHLFLHP